MQTEEQVPAENRSNLNPNNETPMDYIISEMMGQEMAGLEDQIGE